MLGDFLDFLVRCVHELVRLPSRTAAAVGAASVAGVLCFLLCWWAGRLWNKGFHRRFRHYILCVLAGSSGFVATVAVLSLGFTQLIAEGQVLAWRARLETDRQWNSEVFPRSIYDAVNPRVPQAAGAELRGWEVLIPDTVTSDPTNLAQICELFADTAVSTTLADFTHEHPWLSFALSPTGLRTKQETRDQVLALAHHKWAPGVREKIYYTEIFDPIASQVQHDLQERTPRVVLWVRFCSVLAGVVAVGLCFGLISLEAYRELRVTTPRV